jgi:hypothetical protein
MAFVPVQRKPVPYDVVQVAAGVLWQGRHLESVLLTVTDVAADGSEIDATEYTGGPLIHLLLSQFRLVSPPRGA